MLFAVTDIETTGGYAAAARITEVSVSITDGHQILDSFTSLVNPGIPIPYHISRLTGITHHLTDAAPAFHQIAHRLFPFFDGKIFVAHNVNFDYSFLKAQFAEAGFHLQCPKLCTVRISRKIFPGLTSYNLGSICHYLNIPIHNRHRAAGDTLATVHLLHTLLRHDQQQVIPHALKRHSRDPLLPPHLAAHEVDQLSTGPGVYYFHDSKGKVIYVGKARNLRQRVRSHFANNSTQKQKQDFLREVHHITSELCGSELVASILESHEIKRLWPKFNQAQKGYTPAFGIIQYLDQRGIIRLAIQKCRPSGPALHTFSTSMNARAALWQLVSTHHLCPVLCGLASHPTACTAVHCPCHIATPSAIEGYNHTLRQLIHQWASGRQNLVIIEQGRSSGEITCLLMRHGTLQGFAFLPAQLQSSPDCLSAIQHHLRPIRENFHIRQMLQMRLRSPEGVIFQECEG